MRTGLHKFLVVSAVTLTWAMSASAQTAPAQTQSSSGGLENIVVTARKREETLIATPVVVSALSAATLQKYGVTTLDDVSRMVPMLMIAPATGSVQGGGVSIRGIAGPDTNPFGDQAVSFNVDGVAISLSSVRRMTDTDTSQIEVLKGPQALFYGKNSPGGIVTIHSADPTNHFEAKAMVGYEAEADEIRGEGYISGPVTDSLGFRLSGFYSHTDGWLPDSTYGTGTPYASPNPEAGRSSDFGLRGTLKYDPGTNFDAKLKLNFGQTRNDGPADLRSFDRCPLGARETGSGLPCGTDTASNAGSGPVVGTIPGTLNSFGNGNNFQHQQQFLGGLEMNYKLSDQLKLTSVTGYYWVGLKQCQNYEDDSAIILPSCNPTSYHQFSEDFRVTSDYEGPVNFTAGGYYGHTTAQTGSITYLFGGNFDLLGPGFGGPATPAMVNDYLLNQTGNAYSAYMQLIYKPIDVVEVDAGGRYSYEKKSVTVRDGGGLSEGVIPGTTNIANAYVPVQNPNRSWSDFSPEVTISYRPSHDLTVFGSYKHGFLSGGFNSSSTLFVGNPDIGYNPETIKGFEVGVKSLLLDEKLAFNVAGYLYKMAGLQVTNFQNATSSIHNAASSNIRGVETDFNYKTMIEGLGLHGAAAYNRAYYTSFPNAPCYNGQTPALGCSLSGNTAQSLGGHPLPRAPLWNLNGGFSYDASLPSDFTLGLSADVTYSSSYLTSATNDPLGREPAYAMVNTAVRLSREGAPWELSFIGNNLSNKHIFYATDTLPFTGTNGGITPGVHGDVGGVVTRGRELWVRASYKFGG